MDDEDHTRIRRQLAGEFTVRRMEQLRPTVQRVVNEHIDALGIRTQADLYADFALPIPSIVICELLGVPEEDRHRFQQDSTTTLDMTAAATQKQAARSRLHAYMAGLVRTKRAHPGDDLLGRLVLRQSSEATPLSDEELTRIGNLLLVAGHETTANMIALGLAGFLTFPDWLERLQRYPDAMRLVVDEQLRLHSIVQHGLLRVARCDTELNGVHIAKGDYVLVALSAANRDPEIYSAPGTFNPHRDAQTHVAFGHGPHKCIGQNLARLELEVAWSTLLRRVPSLRLSRKLHLTDFKQEMTFYGVAQLPVTWGWILPA
ncbi:cytochrome P450 [Streptomyces sp. NPDC058272]|uniref:cytochrome P450 n=1 Tax=Streptomyces sp. NPDC058272 TaxID=3346415 RepID=UPI0036E40946